MTMKYETYIPMQFDLTTLQSRVTAAQEQISKHHALYMTQTEFFTEYDQMVKDGFVRDPMHPVLVMPSGGSDSWIQVQLVKPKKALTKEAELIAITVEAEYRAEIKADQAEALKRMQARIIGESLDKKAKEQAAERAQLEAAALAQALEILHLTPDAAEAAQAGV